MEQPKDGVQYSTCAEDAREVRFLPAPPPKDTDIDTMSVFFLFAVSSVEDANIG